MTENPERRQSSRIRPEQLVYVELEQDNGGMMLNVSEQGFGFHALNPLRQDGEIHFAFAIDAGRHLEGYGELKWAEQDAGVGGLRFTEVSQEFREEIRRWLNESHTPVDKGKKSLSAVATAVATQEEYRCDVKAEPRESLPSAPKVEKPEIAMEQLPINVPRHDKETAILPEQIQLKVEEKGTGVPVKQKEADVPSLSAMNIQREKKKITISPETMPVEPVQTEPKKAQPPVDISVPTVLEQVDKPKVLWGPRERDERIQELRGLVLTPEITSARLNRGPALGIVLIGLTVLFVAVGYNFRHDIGESVIWLGEKIAGESRQARAETAAATTDVSGILHSGPPVADTPTEPVASRQADQNPSVNNSNLAAAVTAPVTTPVTAKVEPGQSELARAERILGSKNASQDITGAVKLLWAAVGKGNTAAAVRLSELYVRGGVIPKNCDQARVLLTVVAKKGHAGAKAKLQRLDKEGCP